MTKSSIKKTAKFYLAEDARLDQASKPIIIGLYATDKIIITLPEGMSELPPDQGVMLSGIAILICLSGFTGSIHAKISINSPSGKKLMEENDLGKVTINNTYGLANIVAKFVPFRVIELGIHKLTIQIGKSKFDYGFEINIEK